MKTYRISKYNPIHRNNNGDYLRDEWTSISDIGKQYGDSIFKSSDYLKVENKYATVLEIFLNNIDCSSLLLVELEKYFYKTVDNDKKLLYNDDLERLFNKLTNNYCFRTLNEVLNATKLILREHLWGKIISIKSDLRIEFGNEFYLYLISDELSKDSEKKIHDTGLYLEKM